MKISKRLRAAHEQAMELLVKEKLTWDEQQFFFDNYHEGAESEIGKRGAFFTPTDLALDAALEAGQTSHPIKVIDLCAGIGVLSWAMLTRCPNAQVTAIEQNPKWVEIGKKLLPEVNWICADVRDLDWKALGYFDQAITNPPFGAVPTLSGLKSPRYTGSESHYKILDFAAIVASDVTAILPQTAVPWSYSGVRQFTATETEKTAQFLSHTGIELDMNMGIDTTAYEGFKSTNIKVEVVSCEYEPVSWDDLSWEPVVMGSETAPAIPQSESNVIALNSEVREASPRKRKSRKSDEEERQFSLAL